MLDNIFILPISIILSFLSGLGIGGGSILVLWLTLVLNYSQQQARLINLLAFLPCALIATIYRWNQRGFSYKKVLPAIITGCISAGFCSYWSGEIGTGILKKIFGALLLLTGAREILYKCEKKEHH